MEAITKVDLKKMNEVNNEDFVIINVLEPQYFNKQHIRTSINIPHQNEDFEDLVKLVAGTKDRKVVVYCASFDCDASTKAAQKLDKSGFKQVYDYEGGTKDWFENSSY